jgi:uncharacterized protein (TIGR02271 family)
MATHLPDDDRMETPHDDAAARLELREEVLQPGAEPAHAGTVRLSRRVVEREETVTVPLREEVLVVEHVAGDGTVRVGDRELAPGDTLELVIYQERPVVHKAVARYESVTVRKALVERTATLQETVRREQLAVLAGAEFIENLDALGPDVVVPPADSAPAEKPSPVPGVHRHAVS